MICKNEEALIGRALESVKWADSIHILDTGSKDNTVQIALQYTPNVYLDSVWVDDFSYHQNLVKSRTTDSWILSLDSDEVCLSTEEEVRAAVEQAKDVVRVTMVAEGDQQNTFGFGRLFRNTPEIYWEAAIHKHLNVPGEGEPVGDVRIQYGYSPAHLIDPDRSLRMLEKAVDTEANPVRNLYYLGREYWYKKRYQDCINTFKRYIKVAHWRAELADAYLIMAEAFVELKQIEESAAAVLHAIKLNSNFKEAIQFMANISVPGNKKQWLRMAKTANNNDVLWKRVPAEPIWNNIFLAPHNDDESLFGALTLIRKKPLVVVITDSYIQPERGDAGCDATTRRLETINACAIAECPVVFLGIKDTELTEEILRQRLKPFNPETIYAPAIQGGNAQHDMVGRVAKELFGADCQFYTTYTKTELYTTGTIEIKPVHDELEIKDRMLACYKSQLSLPSTQPHFEAVRGRSEWLTTGLKKVMIVPFFGDLPEWMDKFKMPDGYDLLFDQDIEEFKRRVKDKLGIEYPGTWGSGKVWDYRGALGLLYEDEIKSYDYYGHCDLDVVFGDVNKFVTDEMLMNLDVYSGHKEYVNGCFSLYRNSKEVRELFLQCPEWKDKMSPLEPTGWIEKEYSRKLEQSGLRYKYDFQQGNPWTDKPNLRKDGNSLFQEIGGEWFEIALYHFRHSKRWPL